jgi:hypothetical protein
MDHDQFFYWLQGYFEISGTTEPLTAEQAQCIERHVSLVRAGLTAGQRLDERISVIETMAKLLRTECKAAISKVATTAIRQTIHEQFEHVIDPKAGGAEQQAKLDAIHHGPRPLGSAPVYRC